jgi:hypothetical protein
VTSGDWRDASKLPSRLEKHAATWKDGFDYCRSVCRTNSKSTVHENAYAHAVQHHCFGDAAFPSADVARPLPPLPAGVFLRAAAESESCVDACAKASPAAACAAEALPLISSCDFLLANFACEAGCEAAPAGGAHLPAYNSGSVAEASTKCLYAAQPAGGAVAAGDCAAKGANARRLCPCKATAA